MNGKKARNLRKLIAAQLPNLPERNYVETNKREKLFPAGLNSDGTTRYVSVPVSTVTLEGCQRKAYQQAKSLHHVFYGR